MLLKWRALHFILRYFKIYQLRLESSGFLTKIIGKTYARKSYFLLDGNFRNFLPKGIVFNKQVEKLCISQ